MMMMIDFWNEYTSSSIKEKRTSKQANKKSCGDLCKLPKPKSYEKAKSELRCCFFFPFYFLFSFLLSFLTFHPLSSFFTFFFKVYIFIWKPEWKEKNRDLSSVGSLSRWLQQLTGPSRNQSQLLHLLLCLVSHVVGMCPSAWLILCCLCRHISRELLQA